MAELIQHYSYFGLFLIIFAEEGGVPLPIPGDIFIAAAAALPNTNYFALVATVAFATLLGSTILFTLSRTLGHKLLTRFGKYIKLDQKKIKRVEGWFQKYGRATIVIGRFIPGLRVVTPFTAGLFKVSYRTFWVYTTIAALIWANIYYVIGKFFGEIIFKFVN